MNLVKFKKKIENIDKGIVYELKDVIAIAKLLIKRA